MKLYESPRGAIIKTENGDEFKFHHINEMFAYCTTAKDEIVNLEAWTEIKVIENFSQENEK